MFGRIADIVVRPFQPPGEAPDLLELFAPYRRLPYAMLLLSGGDLDCASHSLMGWDPFLVMEAKGSQVRLARGTECIEVAGNPFDILEDLLGALEIPGPTPLAPFAAGGLGFLAYDLKNHLERLPTTALDDLNLPDLVLGLSPAAGGARPPGRQVLVRGDHLGGPPGGGSRGRPVKVPR